MTAEGTGRPAGRSTADGSGSALDGYFAGMSGIELYSPSVRFALLEMIVARVCDRIRTVSQ